MDSFGDYKQLIIAGSLFVVIFVLLKIGLIIVRAEKRTNIKWVGYSFLIQIGLAFGIGSPLMLLGFAGAFDGDPVAIIPIIIVVFAINLNVINVIHQIGLKRSLAIMSMLIVPIIFSLYFLGSFIGRLQYS